MLTHMQTQITYADTNNLSFLSFNIYPYINTEAPSHTSSFVARVEDTVSLLPKLWSHDPCQHGGGSRSRRAGNILDLLCLQKGCHFLWVLCK